MPFEGPAALEALANGCFFINPKVYQRIIIMSTACFFLHPYYYVITTLVQFFRVNVYGPGDEHSSGRDEKKYIEKKNYERAYILQFFLKFIPAYDRLNHGFFAGKPMNRKVCML